MTVMAGMVTTIIPVFNRPALLQEAALSVMGQTCRPIGMIVVDDRSTDRTAEVAEALRHPHPGCIRVVRQSNAGPGRAQPSGLDLASGEFIQLIDSDDIVLPRKFAPQVEALRSSPDAEIACGQSYEENHRKDPPRCCGPIQPWINEEDWEFEVLAAAAGAPLAFVEEIVSVHRVLAEGERLSDAGSSDRRKLRDRALSRQSILASALKAGVAEDAPEMASFSRAVFLLARQCAEAGLGDEAADLHTLACRASPWSAAIRARLKPPTCP